MNHWRQLLIALIGFGCIALAKAEVTDLSIDWQQYFGTIRMLEVPSTNEAQALGLNLDLEIYGPIYWKNRVHSISTPNQFKWVGWQFELGARLASAELFYAHHSQHTFEGTHPFMGFPVQNSLGFRWRILP